MTAFHVHNEPELFNALRLAKQDDRIWIYGNGETRDYEIHTYTPALIGLTRGARLKAPHLELVKVTVDDVCEFYGSAREVRAHRQAKAVVHGRGLVRATGDAQIEAHDSVYVEAYDATVKAYDTTVVTLLLDGKCDAYDYAHVIKMGCCATVNTYGPHVTVT